MRTKYKIPFWLGVTLFFGVYILISFLMFSANQEAFKLTDEELRNPTPMTHYKQAIREGYIQAMFG
ncbi:TPA: hypothetical protein KKX77_002636 [Legionella pneumophila]|nr:hypothetical protein [Legionella pneumophila]HCU5995165.1 hypothetical protein [Legionella pneumophila]